MAAMALSRRGFSSSAAIAVQVLLVGARERLKGDAAAAAERWTGPVITAQADGLAGAKSQPKARSMSVIDALFGAGLDRPVEGLPRAVIESMNDQGAAGRRGRPAERDQRHVGRRHGRGRQRRSDGDLLSQEAGPSPSAGAALLR